MLKQVELNTIVTPAGNLSTARGLIGEVITPARERMQPGSVAGAAFQEFEGPMIAVVSASWVLILGLAAVSPATPGALQTEILALLDGGGTPYTGGRAAKLVAGSGTTRSRAVVPDPGMNIVVESASLADFAPDVALVPRYNSALAHSLLLPVPRTYTAAQLINAVDDHFAGLDSFDGKYLAVLDQTTATFEVFLADGAAPDFNIEDFDGVAGYSVLAAYNLTALEDLGAPALPSGPVWG